MAIIGKNYFHHESKQFVVTLLNGFKDQIFCSTAKIVHCITECYKSKIIFMPEVSNKEILSILLGV
jgi:hypothetical protein